MKNGKYQNKKSGFNVRPLVLMLAVALLIGATIGGTIAWLTASTQKVENTFTVGDINITLEETGAVDSDITDEDDTQKKNFKMVPGNTIDKDPKVTVKANSEDCWLFVKVEKSSVLDTYIAYAIDTQWTEVPGHAGFYYKQVALNTADQTFNVLGEGSYKDDKGTTATDDDVTYSWADNQVRVKHTVTKADMDNLNKANAVQPTLTFEAAAVQQANITTVAAAWDELPAAFKTTASGSTN